MNGLDRCFFDQRKCLRYLGVVNLCGNEIGSSVLWLVEAVPAFNGTCVGCFDIFSGRAVRDASVNLFSANNAFCITLKLFYWQL